eukprot:507445_1
MQSAKSARVLRPYSPSKWYDCWKYRIENGLSSQNKFYKTLNGDQTNELHYWLSQCFMKIDMLLFDHDNHAVHLERNDNNATNRNFQHFQPNDSVKFVSKCMLPRALIVSTELPIGYVNFKKYNDFIKTNNENLYSDLLGSDLGTILEANSHINDNIKENKYYQHVHPTEKFWTPKYSHIEGYEHPIWEIVDCIIEYLYRMSIYFHKHDMKLTINNYDNMEISDGLIHYSVVQTFINRYIKDFSDIECPNPMVYISENPPSRLCDKYPHILPLFFSEIFRIIHLNGYVNQSLYLRNIFGHGLYSLSSFYDHSCDPNIVYATYNGKLRMILIKEIKEYEPLTTSYLAEFIDQIDFKQRKERLKWMGFNCLCDRCKMDAKMDGKKEKDNLYRRDEKVLPTIWSELRYFHHVLSEGINERWKSKLFRIACLGNRNRLVKWYMTYKVKTGIVEPAYECFHTLDVLCPDAALNDILCTVALTKFKKKYYDRTTEDRELSLEKM